jgi:adenine phosphoribosyltransferase
MTMLGRGPRPRVDPQVRFADELKTAFQWHGDRTDDRYYADVTGWWANPAILRGLGPALAGLFPEAHPTVVLGPQSRGALLGALVAAHLGLGLVELRKEPEPSSDSDRWLITHTPPDYRDRNLQLGARREHLTAGHRVLFVDDWIDTGGQTIGARDLVRQAGATWCGAAVVVDALHDSRLRRELDVRPLLHLRELR